MKPIKILIFLSLIFGSYSVFSQESNNEVKKSDFEKKTEQVDPELRLPNQPPVLNSEEGISETKVESKSANPEPDGNNNGINTTKKPRPNETDVSLQHAKPKAKIAPSSENKTYSEEPAPNADPDTDPNKLQ